MLIDDHSVVREGLRAALENIPDLIVVAEAGCGDAALRIVEAAAPDVILIDLKMPGLSAAETIRGVKRIVPSCNILVFTSFAEDGMLQAALQAGAVGYLLKDASCDDLINAVRSVWRGETWLHETT